MLKSTCGAVEEEKCSALGEETGKEATVIIKGRDFLQQLEANYIFRIKIFQFISSKINSTSVSTTINYLIKQTK